MMRIENWCGHNIRFMEVNGEWYAILKDICEALGLKTYKLSQRLESSMIERVQVKASDIPSKYNRSRGENETRWMIAVNELGIYEALFASRKPEARKFRIWAGTVMQKLRKTVGLKGYEVMKMTDPDIQDEIDDILDALFYDEETGKLMQSITVRGGDVEQIPFEE